MRFYLKLIVLVALTFVLHWGLGQSRETMDEIRFVAKVFYVTRFGTAEHFDQLVRDEQEVLQRHYRLNLARIAVELEDRRRDDQVREMPLEEETAARPGAGPGGPAAEAARAAG